MRLRSLAVEATVSADGAPQAAAVGFVVTDDFEIFFDTLDSTRKFHNLRANAAVAFVIGGTSEGDENTVQYEGIADEPAGEDLMRLKQLYFRRFPDGRGRERCKGITYFRVRPRWLRFSDYTQNPPAIAEWTFGGQE
jgi:uncharacterized protein YhbP (UPF0306 family)